MVEHAGSGLSVAAFCRERGLPASQFFAWKMRLSQAASKQFVEVRVARAEEPAQRTTAHGHRPLRFGSAAAASSWSPASMRTICAPCWRQWRRGLDQPAELALAGPWSRDRSPPKVPPNSGEIRFSRV